MSELIVRGGLLVTIDPSWTVVEGDLHVVEGRIVQVGGQATPQTKDYNILDASGCLVLPGFVQTHVHTCQTLARGRADDLELLDWLQRVVWPYEAALGPEELAIATRLSAAELLLGGTTCVQDMATVHHTDAVFRELESSGIRAVAGKCLMDDGAQVPASLREGTKTAMTESIALCERWDGAANGRLRYAFTPRFVLSCTDGLLRDVVAEARLRRARIHTHASENRKEIEAVRKLRGDDNVTHLHKLGMSGPNVGLAHCVWLSDAETEILRTTGTHVLHCPSSNLKLASGIAPIPELLAAGVSVSLGADGAPCNNNLDAFQEMRLAALLHKPRLGPRTLPAREVLRMATLGGARALGLEDDVGSLEVGKKADIVAVEWQGPHVAPTQAPYSALVYACQSRDVRHVVVDGHVRVRSRELLGLDLGRTIADAYTAAHRVFGRL